ncbi:hypothetical protein ASZ90_019950 [hydrocarbon metagenome]|uniref:Uncharacterized protein n=1 Tax=hydrocarbon metagenome TaxID=938273 RepID=A0A0W8E2G1_9ZZZZ
MGVKRNIFRLGISFSITAVIIFAMVFLADLPTARAGIDGSNVSPETAYTITPGQTEYLSIDYLDDFDWYKITVDHTCSLIGSISNNSGLLRYNVYDSNLTELSSVYYGVTTTGSHGYKVAPGTYYIKLYEYTPNRGINYMQSNISLKIDIREQDSYENNDTLTKMLMNLLQGRH